MKRHLYLILLVVLSSACGQEEWTTPFKEGQEVVLTANMYSASSSDVSSLGVGKLIEKQRITGKDDVNVIRPLWSAGDQISVIVDGESSVFTLVDGANTSCASFRGIMPKDGLSYHVQYPVNEPDLSKQLYTADGFGNGLMKMSTESPGTIEDGFTLRADYAVLGLQLTGIHTISDIVLTNPDGGKTYTLDKINVTLDKEQVRMFYFVVPEGTWKRGFTVDVYAGDFHIKRLAKQGSVTFSSLEATIMAPQYVGPPSSPEGQVTVTIYAAPRSSKVKLYHSRDVHQADYSITVDKDVSVLYVAYNSVLDYLSQSDSLLRVTKDTIMYVRLSPFSEGNWVEVDKSTMELTRSHFISRNSGRISPEHSNWCYFVMPCEEGEEYRVRTGAGQLAAPWYAAVNKPDIEQGILPKKVACSESKGIVGYVAEEFVIPAGANYLIINSNDASKMMLERRETGY